MIKIKDDTIEILHLKFPLQNKVAVITESFATEIVLRFSGGEPLVFSGRVLLHWLEVSELIIYLWITDNDRQVWLKELNIHREQTRKFSRKPFRGPITCEHYVLGETAAGLNEEIEESGSVIIYRRTRNMPGFRITKKNSRGIDNRILVAIYSHETRSGYFFVTDFAWFEDNQFADAGLSKETRKYLDNRGIVQPEFTKLE